MTVNDRPGKKDYFSQKWIDCMPFFGDIESRSRLSRYTGQVDIACKFLVSQETPLQLVHQKLEMLWFIFSQNVWLLLFPERILLQIKVVSLKYCVGWIMYNPQKPTKWSLYVYVLADCEIGHICIVEPYYGPMARQVLPRSDLCFTSRFVIHFCHTLLSRA